MKVNNLLISILTVLGTSSIAWGNSQVVQDTAKFLTDVYENNASSIVEIQEGDGSDIEHYCMSKMFATWANPYVGILAVTELPLDKMKAPLEEFGNDWYFVIPETKIIEFERPNVTKVLESKIEELRKRFQIPLPDFSKMSASEVFRKEYEQNIMLCALDELRNDVKDALPKVDLGRTPPPEILALREGRVEWYATEKGGIRPAFRPKNASSTGNIADSFSLGNGNYERYLNALINRSGGE